MYLQYFLIIKKWYHTYFLALDCFQSCLESALLEQLLYSGAFWSLDFLNALDNPERTKQMKQILNFQVTAEGLELVILGHTQFQALKHHKLIMIDDSHPYFFLNKNPILP